MIGEDLALFLVTLPAQDARARDPTCRCLKTGDTLTGADTVSQSPGLSCNELGSHDKWVADIEKFGGNKVGFPIIADPKREVAHLYDMVRSKASVLCQNRD